MIAGRLGSAHRPVAAVKKPDRHLRDTLPIQPTIAPGIKRLAGPAGGQPRAAFFDPPQANGWCGKPPSLTNKQMGIVPRLAVAPGPGSPHPMQRMGWAMKIWRRVSFFPLAGRRSTAPMATRARGAERWRLAGLPHPRGMVARLERIQSQPAVHTPDSTLAWRFIGNRLKPDSGLRGDVRKFYNERPQGRYSIRVSHIGN